MGRTTSMSGTSAPKRAPLTRERVLAAGVALADAEGTGTLSMRRLARDLGFEVMSLYNHVAGKDDLLDGMLDMVAAEIDLPVATLPWKPALRAIALATRDALLRHPWAGPMWVNRMVGPARLRHMEAVLAALARSGLPQDVAHHGFHALNNHILGFTLQEQAYGFDAEAFDLEDFLAQLPQDDLRHFIAHVRQHLDGPPDEGEFEFGLDLVLDGLERLGRRA